MKECLEIHRLNNLRHCIKALLLDADANKLTDDFLHDQYNITEERLVGLLRHECGSITLDQVRAVAQMFLTQWMMPGVTRAHVQYAQEPTMFNMLLHFVDNGMLHIDSGVPVCQCEGVLRWNDLTSFIGEDFMVCAYLAGHDLITPNAPRRKDFNWPPYLRTDDPTLNVLLEMPLADIHAHLKGSSLNFEINWICLMNHIEKRKDLFEGLESNPQSDHIKINQTGANLYRKAVLAAAIRAYLLEMLYYGRSKLLIQLGKLMNISNVLDIATEAGNIQGLIEKNRLEIGKVYKSERNGETAVFDYAIINGVNVNEENSLTLLSGERYILYSVLKNIYGGDYEGPKTAFLFYLYLVIKNEIRQEIIQLNDSIGFDNFRIYENRKQIFVKGFSHYENAAIHLAMKGFFGDSNPNNRYHEARITPGESGREIVNTIKKIDKAIESDLLKKDDISWNYKYIFHFIKMPDKLVTAECRHYLLRNIVKKQSLAIYKYRNSLDKGADNKYVAGRAVGIDAANSEVACRPEVFAQAFRFLRHHTIEHEDIFRPNDLGVTYHVGEDLRDVVDGLRAVKEAILFLQLKTGDRIGHGLVLGVDVDKYYKARNYTIAMSLQVLMDNMAWLHYHVSRLKGFENTLSDIKETFEDCYRRVYIGSPVPSVELYYNSMLLRGDAPECYKADGSVTNQGGDLAEWMSKSLNDEKGSRKARKQTEACKLYHKYHYDLNGKNNGLIYEEWTVNKEIIKAIKVLQRQLLDEVEELDLAIECNPTSNRKIGEFERYDEHPILRFNNDGLGLYPSRAISVSINTDDKGIFATSIEREYALIAHSLIRHFRLNDCGVHKNDVYDWLDKIRANSLAQRFDKEEIPQGQTNNDNLLQLKAQISKELDDETRGRRFLDRLKYGLGILFGKKEG